MEWSKGLLMAIFLGPLLFLELLIAFFDVISYCFARKMVEVVSLHQSKKFAYDNVVFLKNPFIFIYYEI